jgi:hypothetical protein
MTTYGEYIKTKAAQSEADSHFRRYLNNQIKGGYKLIKLKKGSRGSLDYGKTVLLMSHESGLEDIDPKAKPYLFVMRWNFGLVRGSKPLEFKMFKLRSAAEKQYQTWVRMLD